MVSAVPLIYLPGLYAFVWAPKHLVLNFCIALTCLGWIVHILRLRRVSLVSTPLFLPLICFLGVAVLSAPGSTHSLDTLTELSKNAALIVLLVVVANSLSLEQIRPILWASSATGLVVGMVGVLQYHGLAVSWIPSAAPPSATFGNRNFAAEYLICAIPLSILQFLTSSRKTPVLLSGLSTTLMGVFLIYTRTRSAWVGAGGAVLLVCGLLSAMPGLRRSMYEALRSEINRRKSVLAFGFLFFINPVPKKIGCSMGDSTVLTEDVRSNPTFPETDPISWPEARTLFVGLSLKKSSFTTSNKDFRIVPRW